MVLHPGPVDAAKDQAMREEERGPELPWPLSAFSGLFNVNWSDILNIPQHIYNFFKERFGEFAEWVWNNVAGPLIEFAYDVYEITDEWTAGWPAPWKYLAQFMLFPSAFIYKSLRDVVMPALEEAKNAILTAFDGALNTVADTIRSVFSPIIDPISNFFSSVLDFFTKKLPEWLDRVREFITETLPSWFDRVRKFFTDDLPGLFDKIRDALSGVGKAIVDAVTSGVETFKEALAKALGWVSQQIQSFFTSIVRTIVDAFRDVMNALSAAVTARDPIQGIINALRSLTPLLVASIPVALMFDIASAKVVGTGIDLDAVKELLKSVFPVDKVHQALLSGLFTAAIVTPINYIVNRIARPHFLDVSAYVSAYFRNIITYEQLDAYVSLHGIRSDQLPILVEVSRPLPSVADAWRWLNKQLISLDEFRSYLRSLGWKEQQVDVWIRDLQYDLRLFDLYRIFDTVSVDPEWLVSKLEVYGYDVDDMEYVALSILRRPFRDDVRRIVYGLIELYEMGLLSDDELASELKRIEDSTRVRFVVRGWSGTQRVSRPAEGPLFYLTDYEKRALIEYARMRRRRFIARQRIYSLLRDLRAGRITREKFVEEARRLGMDVQLAEALADSELRGYELSVGFMLRIADALRLDPQWLVHRLRERGVPDDVVPLVLKYMVVRRLRPYVRRVVERLYSLYVQGFMDRNELRSSLRSLGLADDEIEYIVIAGDMEFERRLKAMTLRTVLNAYRRCRISRDEALKMLTSMGMPMERAERLLQVAEEERRMYLEFEITRDERNRYRSALERAFARGIISYDDIVRELRELQYNDDEISWIVRRAQLEFEIRTKTEMARAVLAAYRRGRISRDEAMNLLLSIGIVRERAESMLWAEDMKRRAGAS